MATEYTIGELAEEVGVPTSTLRYYERSGLVRPDGRTNGNYRIYGNSAVERVRFIRAAQATGFTLEDIARLLDFKDGGSEPCNEVESLITHRVADTEKRMEDLQRTQTLLRSCLRLCREAKRRDRCKVMENLKTASRRRSSPRHKRTKSR